MTASCHEQNNIYEQLPVKCELLFFIGIIMRKAFWWFDDI